MKRLLLSLFLLIFLAPPVFGASTTREVWDGSEDVEEDVSTGAVTLDSSDLEIPTEAGAAQEVAVCFDEVYVPPGSTITNAYIQFTTDEVTTASASTTIYGVADSEANPYFSGTTNEVSNLSKTTASVAWNSIPGWDTIGEAGVDQRTPDLSSIIQEIIEIPGWYSTSSMCFVFSGGSGTRTAVAFDGNSAQAPVLHLTFDGPQIVVSDTFSGVYEQLAGTTPDRVGTSWVESVDTTGDTDMWMRGRDSTDASPSFGTSDAMLIDTATPASTLPDVYAEWYFDNMPDDDSDDPVFVVLRYQDASNFYALMVYASTTDNNAVYLLKNVGGTVTELASTNTDINTDDFYRFEIIDNTLTFYINGVSTLNATDSSITGAGRVGLGAGNLRVATDDVRNIWWIGRLDFYEIESGGVARRIW